MRSLALAALACAPTPHGVAVLAASSLREAFSAIARDFERAHPAARVTFDFAGSQELALQIESGAPADVIAAADEAPVAALRARGLVGEPAVFACNELVVVVPASNPARLASLLDLPRAERIVVGVPESPIGRYTLAVLDRASARDPGFRARVEARVVSREPNVKQVLAKVILGEADAGVVYASDARAAGAQVRAIAIPRDAGAVARYPIALVRGAGPLARAWVDAVLSPAGRAALAGAGFVPCER